MRAGIDFFIITFYNLVDAKIRKAVINEEIIQMDSKTIIFFQ